MSVRLLRRVVSLALLTAGISGAFAPSALAADDAPITLVLSPQQSAQEMEAAIKAATQGGKQVVVRYGDPAQAAPTPTVSQAAPQNAAKPAADPLQAMNSMWMVNDLQAAFVQGTESAISGVAVLPGAFQSSWDALNAEPGGARHAAWSALLSAAAGIIAAYLVRAALSAVAQAHQPRNRFTVASLRLVFDILGILTYHVTAHNLMRLMLEPESFGRQMTGALLAIVTGTLIYAAIGRFLFQSNRNAGERLIEIGRPRWHFAMLLAYGATTSFINNTVHLADLRMLDAKASNSWLFITATILTLLKLYWFIAGRREIAAVFAGRDAGHFRRMMGGLLADSYIFSAIFIWAAGLLVAGTAQNLVWARAAGLTQFLMIVIPILDLAIVSLVSAMARKREQVSGKGIASVLLWSLRTPLAGAAWLIGLHIVVQLWQPLMMGASTLITTWLLWLERLSLALIVSWSVCGFLFKYFEAIAPTATVIMPGTEEAEIKAEKSRITTILPVVRNLVLGAVIAVASLVVISSAGIDVAPLLAGFGVLGLALSFGSQTLVKDVVSGIFFLAEDAFRIGEYINAGKLMGTVEQISLRSVRLRHHNGPIHTIPFGQISSITNFSRDWGTSKFELRFDRDADLELIRKTAKKVGQALLEEPQFANEFLVPLKMQGIRDVTENSMIVRFKFTSRPGNPSLIRREGLKRLLAAFRAAGLPLASNAVVVRGNSQVSDAGAASTIALAQKTEAS